MSTNNPQSLTVRRIAQQIAVCDKVLERLAETGDRSMEPLIEDVRRLRAGLEATLASMNGDRDGAGPPR